MMEIKETKDVLDFLKGVLDDLAKAKADDGKISVAEWVSVSLTNAPAAVKAISGIDKVDDEIKDLSEDEAKELASEAMKVALSLMSVLGLK